MYNRKFAHPLESISAPFHQQYLPKYKNEIQRYKDTTMPNESGAQVHLRVLHHFINHIYKKYQKKKKKKV